MKKVSFMTPMILTAAVFMVGCSDDEEQMATVNTEVIASQYVTYTEDDFYKAWQGSNFTQIQLNGTSAKASGTNVGAVIIENQQIIVKGAGTYVLEGELTDGQIIVDAEDKGTVRIILNGVDVTSNKGAAIFVKNADKTVISLEEGTENTVTDAATRDEDDEATGAIYSKDDLTINGAGKLVVNANANDGIVGKDALYMTGGTIDIQSVDDGVLGRDLFAMQNVSMTIDAQGDGVKSTNDTDTALGNIVLESGTLAITAGSDGMNAAKDLVILDGEYSIVTGGGSPETVASGGGAMGGGMPTFDPSQQSGAENARPNRQDAEEMQGGPNGEGFDPSQLPEDFDPSQIPEGFDPSQMPSGGQASAATGQGNQTPETTETTDDETQSTKGLKAAILIQILGGTLKIDSLDDAIHSNGNVDISGGSFTVNTGDDGIHADADVSITAGDIMIEKSYEGLEGTNITVSGGHIELTAADDGVNINGGNSDFGQSNTATSIDAGTLLIEDGYLYVNASGDGLDSNGDITMTGGTVLVYGPTSDGDGPLDYDGTFTLNGGILVASGSSGMALGVSDSSTQNTLMMTFPETQQAATAVTVTNADGEQIFAIAPEKAFASMVISTPDLQADTTYEISYGGTLTGEIENGYAKSATQKDAVGAVTFTFDTVMTYLNESGVTEKASGFGGGMGRPNMQGNPGNQNSN